MPNMSFKSTSYEPIKIDFGDRDVTYDIPYTNRAVWVPVRGTCLGDVLMCSECRQSFPIDFREEVCPFCKSKMSFIEEENEDDIWKEAVDER